ncbi:MAG: thermonuclease family protein [Patescibacteria group bacterium]
MTKRKTVKLVLYSIIATVFLIALFSRTDQPTGTTNSNDREIKTEEPAKPETVQPANQVVATQAEIKPAEAPQQQTDLYSVASVTDGDTIKVYINNETETIRLIGMDTPETVDPRKPVQCFGKEASNKAKEILNGKKVRLEADSTQGERDKYNRLLRYVYLEDGTFFNKYLITEGYAHEYTYDSNPYKYQDEFIEAEKQAGEQGKGFWGANTCN